MSAQFGGNTKDAVDALSAALKGERDPIEKYGISLTQNAIDAEAAALGYKKVNGQLTTQATQAATLSLIQKQSADSTGKFARETDTLAHKQQVLSAKWEDAKAKLGNMLLPIVTKVTGFIADHIVPLIGKLPGLLAGLGRVIGGAFVGAWRLLVGVVKTAAGALKIAWEAIKLVFQLGVTAVSAVMSGLATVVGLAWEGVKAVFSAAIAVVKFAWEGFLAPPARRRPPSSAQSSPASAPPPAGSAPRSRAYSASSNQSGTESRPPYPRPPTKSKSHSKPS